MEGNGDGILCGSVGSECKLVRVHAGSDVVLDGLEKQFSKNLNRVGSEYHRARVVKTTVADPLATAKSNLRYRTHKHKKNTTYTLLWLYFGVGQKQTSLKLQIHVRCVSYIYCLSL